MRVKQLKAILNELDDDIEIRIAVQPEWAFEHILFNTGLAHINGELILYLATGNQIGYLPQEAKVAVGWAEDTYNDDYY